ncbi:MAG: Maf family protein [Kiritimatiellae bacterium]|nr:Maf family protein [Kiritimatiellia bacterium]MDW8457990.1 Maf family protein [Verrucomicrobiota bacterium]
MRLILASGSPRRRALLSQLGLDFDVDVSGIEEHPWPRESPYSYALRNATEKARAVAIRHPDAPILAADTIVVLEGKILEKPTSPEEAREMLRSLSGRTHLVVTGVCLRVPCESGFREMADLAQTSVTFHALTDEDVEVYIRTGEPLDKAGAYAIQGGAAKFVARIEGPYDNVVGLPLETVSRLLRRAGVRFSP